MNQMMDHTAYYKAVSARDARFDGRFFTGVKTTGIYCRPICPARTPKSENVTFFQTAAAAQEAGFRPCLRCRPEAAPDLGAWKGTSNTVSRALAMIELGALDGGAETSGGVEKLASRLGVGGRHLRRLFVQHLGATPIAVAQTKRVLLARRLIVDSHLSMADVAMAAGFGSIRRFNETFLQLYGHAPGEFRRKQVDVRNAKDGARMKLPLAPPYDWPAMLSYLKARLIEGVETVSADTYARSFDIEGVTGIVRVSPGKDCLIVDVRTDDLTVLPNVVARVRRLFDLGAQPDRINEDLSKDPIMQALIAERPGLRAPGAWDGFELAVRAVLGQQITVESARKLAGRLVETHGRALPETLLSDELRFAFPSAQTIAEADLSWLPMPRARSLTLEGLGAALRDDPDIFSLKANLQDAVKTLTSLKGVGDWTAHYVAMRAMREADAFPAADVALISAYEKLTGDRLKPKELESMSERWRPWRAYAAQHLWASLAI